MLGLSARLLVMLALLATLPIHASPEAGSKAAAPPEQTRWHADLASARAAARADDRLILVDLYADWCAWCKVLERQVFDTPAFRRHTAERFVLLRVDVEDKAGGSDLKDHYGAYTLPTTLVLDGDLTVVARIQGFAPLDTFLANLDALIEAHHELLAMYQRFHGSSEPEILTTLAQELLDRRDGPRAASLYARLLELGGHTESHQVDLRRRHAAALRLSRWGDGGAAASEPSPGGGAASRSTPTSTGNSSHGPR